ncbi:PaaI family thioesterase [Microvirga sp. TS319]|uniref:PaaI family thioesterase n=1 Tax=Microvirga sp. TS319 TaxID=3241165 RepID=UPI00351A70FD
MVSADHGSDPSGQDGPFDPAAHGWEALSDDGYIGLVGPIWQKPDGNGMRFAFLADSKHRNRLGIVHGGMIMTFADRVLGMTAHSAIGGKPHATIQLDVHFVAAIQIGQLVEARADVVRRTRDLIFMKGDLVVDGRIVATANGIWKILTSG